jgi:hypothetical protein
MNTRGVGTVGATNASASLPAGVKKSGAAVGSRAGGSGVAEAAGVMDGRGVTVGATVEEALASAAKTTGTSMGAPQAANPAAATPVRTAAKIT